MYLKSVLYFESHFTKLLSAIYARALINELEQICLDDKGKRDIYQAAGALVAYVLPFTTSLVPRRSRVSDDYADSTYNRWA